MSALISQLFRGESRLEQCLVQDSAHVMRGDRGVFVGMIQYALLVLEEGIIGADELVPQFFGPMTARLVLKYKTRRNIVNYSYQTSADEIVGKMTIRSLDSELAAFELSEQLCSCRRYY